MWKSIKEWEGLYSINENGDIKNDKTGKLIVGDINNCGYCRVCLYDKQNNRKQRYFRHRLVAMHFLDNPDNYEQVNHIDGDKTNNNVNNLEWCTQSHNCKESHRLGLQIPGINSHKVPKGMIPYNVKKISQYDLDGNFIKTWDTIKSAAISLNNGKYTSSISLC